MDILVLSISVKIYQVTPKFMAIVRMDYII
nr:MAG TPA_asm: hypothetical protein [Caudoviricetes sp.]